MGLYRDDISVSVYVRVGREDAEIADGAMASWTMELHQSQQGVALLDSSRP